MCARTAPPARELGFAPPLSLPTAAPSRWRPQRERSRGASWGLQFPSPGGPALRLRLPWRTSGAGGGRDYHPQHASARLSAARHAGSRSPRHRPPLPAARLETPCGAEWRSFGAPPFREQVGEARGAAGLAMQIFVKTLTGKTITLEVRLRPPRRAHRGAEAAEGRVAAACPTWLLPLQLSGAGRGCGVASQPRCSVS